MKDDEQAPVAGRRVAATVTFATAIVAATPAFAYVGPGAGISLLGALWALAAAVFAAVAFVILWPVRRMMKRRRTRRLERAEPVGHPAATRPQDEPLADSERPV